MDQPQRMTSRTSASCDGIATGRPSRTTAMSKTGRFEKLAPSPKAGACGLPREGTRRISGRRKRSSYKSMASLVCTSLEPRPWHAQAASLNTSRSLMRMRPRVFFARAPRALRTAIASTIVVRRTPSRRAKAFWVSVKLERPVRSCKVSSHRARRGITAWKVAQTARV